MTEEQAFRPDRRQKLTEGEDAFGHEDYATALCRVVKQVRGGFKIGLFAPWGMGKTSILEETVDRLNESTDGESTAAFVFDVWKYEGDSLRRGFIRELGEELKTLRQIRCTFDLKNHLERLEVDQVHLRPKLTWPTLSAIIASLILAAAAVLTLWLILMKSKNAGAVVGGAFATFVLAMLAQVVRVENVQVTRKRLEDSDEFAQSFETLVNKGLKADRLVIGIDNLDRCSPERVTELLSTIKTFLEPAKVDKTLVFVIAADDAALRRHLIAQELASSGAPQTAAKLDADKRDEGGQEEGDQENDHPRRVQQLVPDDVQEAVDEYLRKFFNGVLRVRDLLDEDVRLFAAKELKPFIATHELGEETQSVLVEWVATALKQNPRRILQFINGLELRLQLIAERRNSGRIQIEPDPLMVAKLAIIEERWPGHYQELKENRRLLSTWHEEARQEQHDGDGVDLEHLWHTFLRFSEGTEAPDLGPYLTLQQSPQERELPRYRDFVDAIESGDAGLVDALLADESVAPEADRYREQVLPILKRDATRNYYLAASSIVQVAIESEALKPIATEVVQQALPDPRLRKKLGEVPPGRLLGNATNLADLEFNRVIQVQLDKFEDETEGASEARSELSDALAEHADRFSQPVTKRIVAALAKESVRKDFASYVHLAEAKTDLITSTAVSDALTALHDIEQWGPEEPAYGVAKAALSSDRENDPEHLRQLGEVVTKSLTEQMAGNAESESYPVLADDAAQLVRGLDVPEARLDDSIERFNTDWPNIPPGLRPAAMDFVEAMLTAGAEDTRNERSGPFVDRYFSENPGEAVEWSADRPDGSPFSDAIDAQLGRLASGEDESVIEQAMSTIAKFTEGPKRKMLSAGIDRAIKGGRDKRAAEMLDEHSSALGDERDRRLEQLIAKAEGDDNDTAELVEAVSVLSPSGLSKGLQARQAAVVAEAAANHTGDWRGAYDRIVSGGNASVDNVISRLFSHVGESAQSVEQHLDQVKLLADEQEKLKASERRQLGKILVEGLQRVIASPPDQQHVSAMAESLGKLGKADTEDRRGWVTELIVLERPQGDLGLKEPLLRAADSLAGPRGKARTELSDRLKELKDGTREEKELAARVEQA